MSLCWTTSPSPTKHVKPQEIYKICIGNQSSALVYLIASIPVIFVRSYILVQ